MRVDGVYSLMRSLHCVPSPWALLGPASNSRPALEYSAPHSSTRTIATVSNINSGVTDPGGGAVGLRVFWKAGLSHISGGPPLAWTQPHQESARGKTAAILQDRLPKVSEHLSPGICSFIHKCFCLSGGVFMSNRYLRLNSKHKGPFFPLIYTSVSNSGELWNSTVAEMVVFVS